MVKKERKKVEPKPVVHKENKPHYFPKRLFVVGIFLISLAVFDYYSWLDFDIPRLALDVVILLCGLYLAYSAVSKGSYRRRAAILKRYI